MHRTLPTHSYSSIYTRGSVDNKPTFAVGVVISCNPSSFTADVLVNRIEAYTNVPIVNLYGDRSSGDLSWVNSYRGAQVLLTNVSGVYYILGTIPSVSEQIQDLKDTNLPISSHDVPPESFKGYDETTLNNYTTNRPSDFVESDKILRATDGAELSLLRAGVARLKASPTAQIILAKIRDLVRIVSRRFQLFSDFGEVNITHDGEGKVCCHIKGGASFSEETHPEVAEWTVQSWLGNYFGNTDARAVLRVNNIEQDQFAQIALLQTGEYRAETSKDYSIHTQGQYNKVVRANSLERIDLSEVIEIGGYRDVEIEKDDSLLVNGDKITTILNHHQLNVGKEYKVSCGEVARIGAVQDIYLQSEKAAFVYVNPMNNLEVTPFGVMATSNGIHGEVIVRPRGMLVGPGSMFPTLEEEDGDVDESGELPVGPSSMLTKSIFSKASSEESGSESESDEESLEKGEDDFIISLSDITPDAKIIFEADKDKFISISRKGIKIQFTQQFHVELNDGGVFMSGHLDDSNEGGGDSDL